MRAALLLFTEFPNGPALNAVGCDTQFFPVNLPGMSSAFLDERRKYAKVGIMRNVHNDEWPDSPTDPVKFAERFSQDFTDLASPSFYASGVSPKQCFGLYDGEQPHDPAWHLAMFKRFRQLRNARSIVWALESMQAGWFSPELVAFINQDANLLVAPEFYDGKMAPIAPDRARQDLLDAGLLPERISGFHGLRDEYGVKRVVPGWWNGLLYVENKLANDTVSY
jgi:hypothetical protein